MVFILLSPTPWEEIANTRHENPTPVPHTAARFARWDDADIIRLMNELLTLQLDVHGGQKRGARPTLDVDDEEVVAGVIENVVDVFWSQRARHPIDAPFHLI